MIHASRFHLNDVKQAILLAAIYFALAVASIALFRAGNAIAVIWFANGAAIAVLSQTAYHRWPLFLALIALGIVLANLMMGTEFMLATLFVPGNVVEIIVGALLLRHYWHGTGFFFNLFCVLRFFAFGVLLPGLAGALLSVLIFDLSAALPAAQILMHWLEGSVIGGASILPAAYWIHSQGLRGLKRLLSRADILAAYAFAVAVTILVPMWLPFPFIYISLPLFYIAYQSGVAGTVIANMLVAVTLCTLIQFGVLVPPPSIYSWGYALFYLPVLATLIPPLLLAVAMDMNQSATQALLQSERRYRSLYQRTPVMMFSCDEDGRILTVNDVWLNTMGYSALEVIGQKANEYLCAAVKAQANTVCFMDLLQAGGCKQIYQQLRSKHGEPVDVLMTAVVEFDEFAQSSRLLVVLQDIRDKIRAESLAYHDALTKLPNRLLFSDRLTQACQQHQRTGGAFAVVFVDLDLFKEVNDNYGHEIGDLLLIEVAKRLQHAVRSSDTVCRMGGDEFVLLLAGLMQGDEAGAMADKITQAIEAPCLLKGHKLQISASIGFAFFPQDGTDEMMLMRRADDAMYKTKHQGRKCYAERGT